MAVDVEIRFRGINANMRTFVRLMGAQMTEKVMLNAMSRAVVPVVLAARENVPFDAERTKSGRHIREVIRSFRMPSTLDKGYRVSVSYPRKWYYGHMLEFGTARGIQPSGFLRRAFDAHADDYIREVVDEVERGFKESIARARRMKDPTA